MTISTESPIEADFLASFIAVAGRDARVFNSATLGKIKHFASQKQNVGIVYCAPQVWVGSHRCDFLLATYFTDIRPRMLCVECDGAAFHSSAEQIKRDADRAAEMAKHGVDTIRFTGARLRADAFKCAREAIEAVTRTRQADEEWITLGDCLARSILRSAERAQNITSRMMGEGGEAA